MKNQQVLPENNKKPTNSWPIFIVGTLLLILLIVSASYYYFLYLKKQPVSPEPEPQVNDKLFTEEFLEKLGHPERYYYFNGVVKEVDLAKKTIFMDSSYSGSFMGSAPQPEEPYKVHILVKDDTELSKMTVFFDQPQSQDNPIPKTKTSQITLQDIKVGDTISVSLLPEEADKLDNFEAEKIQVQVNIGQ